jgi:diadenosine tetraphosphatase ApaH/serine/threonine PP2A family protein phosphatase
MPHEANWPPPRKFEEIFAAFKTVCLVGHTHIPGVFREGPRFTAQADIKGSFRSEGEKLLINVGSVGQPRDRDWRACYVVAEDGREFSYRRVEYDVAQTQAKIRAIADLDDRLGERLRRGE